MKTRGGLLVLVPALGAGLAVRLLGLYQGYPELYGHVDETGVAASVWNFFRAGTLRPTEFTYPALFSYLTAAGIWLSAAAGLAPESLTGLTRSIAFLSYVDPAWAALVGRALSALLSTATIGLTYQMGCEIGGRRVGALAAVFLAAAVIPVRQAHMALPDSAMAFFAALCFLFSCQAYRAGRWTSYLGAGVAAGLVLATKHNGAFSALALVAAHLARSRQAGEGLARAWRSPRLWASGVAAAVAAAAASPYLLLAADRYLAVARYQVSSLDFTLVHTTPWWWLVRASVATEFAVGALMWVGLALAVRRRDPHDWLVLAVVAPSFAYIGSWTRESLHYVLHLYPLLLVAAARAVEALAAWLASRWPGGRAPLAGAAPWVAAGLLTVPNAWTAATAASALRRPDTRALAGAWIESHVAPASRLAMTWLPYGPRLELIPARQSILAAYRDDAEATARLLDRWRRRPAYYLVNLETWKGQPEVPPEYRDQADLTDEETRRVFSRTWRSLPELRALGVEHVVLPEAVHERYQNADPPPTGSAAHYRWATNRRYFESLTTSPGLELVALFPGATATSRSRPAPSRGGGIRIYRITADRAGAGD